MRFHLAGAARRELVRDVAWYNQREAGLGDRFLEAVRQAFHRIVRNPDSHPKEESSQWRREIRRCPVVGFPYQVIFEVRVQELFVLARIIHASVSGQFFRVRCGWRLVGSPECRSLRGGSPSPSVVQR